MIIYKQELNFSNPPLYLPTSTKFLHVGKQNENLVVWYQFDQMSANQKPFQFSVIGTGHPFGDDVGLYLGTVQMAIGTVWHVFVKD